MSSSGLSEPEADIDAPGESNNKRRSGRVSRKPNLFTATATSSKRKRDEPEEAETNGQDERDESESESESEGEPDEEEMREKRARARKTNSAPAKKPAAKRPKPNGATVALPVRPQLKGRRKKAKALDEEDAEQAGGLYGQ